MIFRDRCNIEGVCYAKRSPVEQCVPASLLHCERDHDGDDEVVTIALYSAALANCSLGHSLLSPLSFPRCHLAPRPASTSSTMQTMQQGCLHCIDISPAVTCMLIDTFNVSGKIKGIYLINVFVPVLLP